jgi:chemotaxis protein methyltransferase CheR
MSFSPASNWIDDQGLIAGEFPFTRQDFNTIVQMLHRHSGIAMGDGKAALVYSRLVKRLRALGLSSFRDYCRLLSETGQVSERQAMIAALTTNVTRFFREPHHFDYLRDTVLPGLIDHARNGGAVRMWSAACSSGQEPYSIALTLLSMCPEAAGLDIKILANDIDPNVLAHARAGTYLIDDIAPVPEHLRRWFSSVGEGRVQIADEARSLVDFQELNLIGAWPFQGRFDAIFCRNTVIYFDVPTQERIWSRFASVMAPNASLCIGHSERVNGPAAEHLRLVALTTYVPGSRS